LGNNQSMLTRAELLAGIANEAAALGDRAILAVDGVDGSGKTTFADELAPLVERLGRPVIRASIDGFHNPRAVRYARGRSSPEGFFLDSYNYAAFRRHLIDPFRARARSVEMARYDHRTDSEVTTSHREVQDGMLLIVDGIFLHRDELAPLWNMSLFLDVPFATTFARMASRDGTDPDPSAPSNRRYLEGQKLYLGTAAPQLRATIVIDNTDLAAPVITHRNDGTSN
jgi:uridine kinase